MARWDARGEKMEKGRRGKGGDDFKNEGGDRERNWLVRRIMRRDDER